MIRITSFSTLKGSEKNGNQSSGGGGNSSNVTKITTDVGGVNIWGQYHDHHADVSGDMSNVGNITADGNITTTNDINARNITANNNITSNKVMTGDINSSGDLTVVNVDASGAIHADGNIGTESNLSGRNIFADEDVICENIEAGTGNISQLQSINITTEFLTVTKAAHFYKLIIDEIKATEGQILVTPASSGEGLVYVEQDGNYYICYFLAHDMSTGKKINNSFKVGDQVICQTFNAATGLQYNASNRFYWALCTRVSQKPISLFVNGANQECHYIYLDWTDKDQGSNCTPAIGDEIVSLGNRTDTTRQAAITIGAYNNPYLDSGINAPFIIQYDGINNYNLSTHRKNVISNGYNSFFGTFTTTTGDNIEDLIEDVSQGALTYMHTAYANSNDGSMGFSKTYFTNAYYIGFCSNHTQSDAALTYQDYTWCRFRGSNGTSANNYILQSGALSIHVEEDNTSTDDDFIVRGYEFVNNVKTELRHNCKMTQVYENINDYVQTLPLPIQINPYQMEQDFMDGLKTIRLEMYDVDDEEIVAQMEIPIIRNGATGQDLEEYKLVPVRETVPIDKNGTLGINLAYNIMHIVGGNYENITSTYERSVYFKPHYEQTTSLYTGLSLNTTTPSYTSTNFQTNYNTSTNKLLYLDVVLANRHPEVTSSTPLVIYDRRVVYASMSAGAVFSITDEIKSTVQGHTSDINGLTNSVSTVTQQYNQISSTVESHTTLINNIDGRVTTNETNISNITQRADSIESTVQNLKTGAKNLFNFTYCRWTNCVPFIQAYGIEGKASLNRITRLGFDGVGGDFTVSCWMKMKTTNTDVNVNVCDVRDNDQRTVRVTTEWKYYQFHFSNVTNYIGNVADTSNYNGFLDFESNDITNTNRLYVREIMVTRGTVPCDFNVSWKDLENPNTDIIIDWNYSQYIQPTGEYYKGYAVYSPTQYESGDGSYRDFIFANNKTLKPNTPYTLSFYAKAQYTSKIEAFFHDNGGCVDGTCQILNSTELEKTGTTSIANFPNGQTTMHLSTKWQRYIVHWYNQNSGNRSILAYRDSIDLWDDIDNTPNISICGVEFREGYWDKDLLNSQSMIRQTATEIEMKVNSTGINISDGSITLNADNTNIVGNLNLYDTKQGLIIYDQYGNPRITVQNETLGNLDDFDFGGDKRFKTNTTTDVQSSTYNVIFPTITLGTYTVGEKLELHDMIVSSFNKDHTFDTQLNSLQYNFTIKCGTTTVAQSNGNTTLSEFGYTIPNYSNDSLSNSGTYTIQMAITGVTTTAYWGTFNHSFMLYCKTIQTNINKVATDGAVFASSTTKYNWMGQDQTMIRNGNAAMRLKDGKIERNVQTTSQLGAYSNIFMDLTSTVPYTIINSLGYTPTLNDAIIAFSTVIGETDSRERSLHLPHPSTCAGKKYYVKNLVGSTTKVYISNGSLTDKLFIPHASNTAANTLSIDNHSVVLVSIGMYWLEFYC